MAGVNSKYKFAELCKFCVNSLTAYRTRCHAIAKMTARCAQYTSALKIVCKHKSSRRLRTNLHFTILSLFGGEIIFEVFQQMWSRYVNVTDGQTDGQYCGITAG